MNCFCSTAANRAIHRYYREVPLTSATLLSDRLWVPLSVRSASFSAAGIRVGARILYRAAFKKRNGRKLVSAAGDGDTFTPVFPRHLRQAPFPGNFDDISWLANVLRELLFRLAIPKTVRDSLSYVGGVRGDSVAPHHHLPLGVFVIVLGDSLLRPETGERSRLEFYTKYHPAS
jgi:hypothetical protein